MLVVSGDGGDASDHDGNGGDHDDVDGGDHDSDDRRISWDTLGCGRYMGEQLQLHES